MEEELELVLKMAASASIQDKDNEEEMLEEGEVEPMDDEDEGDDNINVIMPVKPPFKPEMKAKEWTDLSRTWRAEESRWDRFRHHRKLDQSTRVSTSSSKPDERKIVTYEDAFERGSTSRAHDRLDFKQRTDRSPAVETKYDLVRREVSERKNSEVEEEVESENVEWTKKLLGPRMRMYADDEEEQRKRVAKIKRLYSTKRREIDTKLMVTVNVDQDEGRSRRRERTSTPRHYSPSPPRASFYFGDRYVSESRRSRHRAVSSSARNRQVGHREDVGGRNGRRSSPDRESTRSYSSSPDRREISRQVELGHRLGLGMRYNGRKKLGSNRAEDEHERIPPIYLGSSNVGRVHRGPINDGRKISIKDRLGVRRRQ